MIRIVSILIYEEGEPFIDILQTGLIPEVCLSLSLDKMFGVSKEKHNSNLNEKGTVQP